MSIQSRITRGIGYGAVSVSMLGYGGGSTVSRLKYWNGSAWVTKSAKYWNGSSFITKPVKYWNGSTWIQ